MERRMRTLLIGLCLFNVMVSPGAAVGQNAPANKPGAVVLNLVALGRFLLLPEDDLTLATVLSLNYGINTFSRSGWINTSQIKSGEW